MQQFGLPNCFVVGIDGFTTPIAEPVYFNGNQATGGTNHSAADPAPGQSMWSAFCFRLRQLGVTERLIVAPTALGGSSAVNWDNNLTMSAPDYESLFPASQHALIEAMQGPNPKIAGIFPNQAEAEASASAVLANAWDTHWGAVFDAYLTFAVARGWAWKKAKRFWISGLQNGSAYTWAPNVRARQQALAAARSDTIYLLEPDATPADLHLWPADQNARGVALANSWFAAA